MESFATPYSVIFFDGEQEHEKGHVGVHSVLTFKRFQALMAQKTGIPCNQLSAVFVCRRTVNDVEKRQKLPISENTNFNIILNQHNPSRERDCYFLVSMKKSKKERRGIISSARKRNAEADAENAEDEDSASPTSRGDFSPADERPKAGAVVADEAATIYSDSGSPRAYALEEAQASLVPAPAPTAALGQQQKILAGKIVASPSSANLAANPRSLPRNSNEEKVAEGSPNPSWEGSARLTESVFGAGSHLLASVNTQSASKVAKVERLGYNVGDAEMQRELALTSLRGEAGAGEVLSPQQENFNPDWHGKKPTGFDLITRDENTLSRANSQHGSTGGSQVLSPRYPSEFDVLRYDRANESSLIHQRKQLLLQAAKPLSTAGGSGGSARLNRSGNSNANGGGTIGSTTPTLLQRSSTATPSDNSTTTRLFPSASLSTSVTTPRASSQGSLSAVVGSPNAVLGREGRQPRMSSSHVLQLAPQLVSQNVGNFAESLGPVELSKLNGMLRGLVDREVRGEGVKICKFCCFLQEKSICPTPFHWCVDDTIIKGFSGPSPAGPIGRPVKNRVEAAA